MYFTRICLKNSQVFYLWQLLEYLSADFSKILEYPYFPEKPNQGICGLDMKSPCCLLHPCISIYIINPLLWFMDPNSYSPQQCWVCKENWYLPSQSGWGKEASHFWHLSNQEILGKKKKKKKSKAQVNKAGTVRKIQKFQTPFKNNHFLNNPSLSEYQLWCLQFSYINHPPPLWYLCKNRSNLKPLPKAKISYERWNQ